MKLYYILPELSLVSIAVFIHLTPFYYSLFSPNTVSEQNEIIKAIVYQWTLIFGNL